MNKLKIKSVFKKVLWGLAGVLILAGLLAGCILVRQCWQNKNLKNIEAVVYEKQIAFDPQSLTDNSETAAGEEIVKKLNSLGSATIIPPNSKIRLPFATYCLDPGYSAPESNVPVVFSYEKVDMPLAAEISNYNIEHPEADQTILQEIFWRLAAAEQSKFADLGEEVQKLLLEINPQAETIVDNYEYNTDLDVKNFVFGNNLPEETVPQKIPGTELYAKITDSQSYSFTELEVYNPTAQPQTFQLLKDSEKLVFVPQGWTKTFKVNVPDVSDDQSFRGWFLQTVLAEGETADMISITLDVVSGKDYTVKDGVLRTGHEGDVWLSFPDSGARIHLGPDSQLNVQYLFEKVPWWENYINNFLIKVRPLNKFQIKTPTIVVAVRG